MSAKTQTRASGVAPAPIRPLQRALWLAAFASSACSHEPAGPPPWFREDALASGLDFVHTSGFEQRFHFPEIACGGVALFDYDEDGDLDVYFVQGGDLVAKDRPLPGNRLYENRGDGSFEDVTARAQVGDTSYGMGCAVGDYDNDGDQDLFVTNLAADVLYRNNGDGTFSDVTEEAGVGDRGWGTSAAFLDLDQDGWLDLFVVNYIHWSLDTDLECRSIEGTRTYCSPNNFKDPAPSTLFLNRGDGTFRDASEESGLRAAFGNGMGVAWGDFDRDGWNEAFVANDLMPNQLWVRAGDGQLADRALVWGCAFNGAGYAASGMGVQAFDLENDGDLDLFVTNLRRQSNTLYENHGTFFIDSTSRYGLAAPSLPYTGFGLGFADFDQDGDLDLYVANGQVTVGDPPQDPRDPYAQNNTLYEMESSGRFAEVLPRGGTAELLVHTSRGAAFGDLDGDRDVDVVVVNRDARPYFLRNVALKRGHSAMFDVRNRHGAPALGAIVRLKAGNKEQWRRVDPAYSYCSSNDPRVHFGLGSATRVEEVLVRWPEGGEDVYRDLAVDELHVLARGAQ